MHTYLRQADSEPEEEAEPSFDAPAAAAADAAAFAALRLARATQTRHGGRELCTCEHKREVGPRCTQPDSKQPDSKPYLRYRFHPRYRCGARLTGARARGSCPSCTDGEQK